METKVPRVELGQVEKVSISIKKGSARISFDAMPSPELLRLIYLQGNAVLNVIFESPQAVMDLKVDVLDRVTGEIKK